MDASHYVEFYDEELDQETYKRLGIASIPPLGFEGLIDKAAVDHITEATRSHLEQGKFVASFGAEHTVTLGLFKAVHEKYPDVSILQIDAHSDLRHEYEGNPYSHASVMARIHELGVQISQVGIRAQCQEEAELIRSNANIQTFYAHHLRKNSGYIAEVLDHLTDEVYITIDADGFDPGIVPGVGTPEPGGLEYYQTLDLLRAVCSNKHIVGFDIVECAPVPNQIQSQYTLAKLAYKVLGYCTLNTSNF
jgi:agmatinase